MSKESNWVCTVYLFVGASSFGLDFHSVSIFIGVAFLGALFLKAINDVSFVIQNTIRKENK